MLAQVTPAAPQQVEWKDPSPHVVKFVPVETDVQLEAPDRPIRQAMSKEMQAAYKPYNPERIVCLRLPSMPGRNRQLT